MNLLAVFKKQKWLNALWFNNSQNDSKLNCRNQNLNNHNNALGMVLVEEILMNIPLQYKYLCSMGNLTLAWRNARKNKTKKPDVIEFEKNLEKNLLDLHYELENKIYVPLPLKTFPIRDPKTRKISKADFRDRVVHHSLLRIVKPVFEKSFVYDSCANQIGKGTSFALKRFDLHKKEVTNHYKTNAFCLKADIKHYFEEVDHETLLEILKGKIEDRNIIWLIRQILANSVQIGGGGERLAECLSAITHHNSSQTYT